MPARSRTSGAHAGAAAPKAAPSKAAAAPLKIPAAPAAKPAKAKGARALPIRSSPVSTVRSLRSSLETLHAQVGPGKKTPARAKTAPFVRKPVLQELEARLLLSADLNPAAQDTLLATPSMQGAEFRALAEASVPTVVTSAQVAPIQRTHELVFVDTQTPEYLKLIAQMRDSGVGEGRNLEFVLINADKDGIRKITDTLAQKSDLDAVHIISHASDGAVQLGTATLDFDALVKRSKYIKTWGKALADEADILFYGCDLARSDSGKSLMDAIARLTGADVAASEDLTGAAAHGGDWDLEFKVGAVEAALAVSVTEQHVFRRRARGGRPARCRDARQRHHGQRAVHRGQRVQAGRRRGRRQLRRHLGEPRTGRRRDGRVRAALQRGGRRAITGEILVNQTTANDQRTPAVATDVNGNFVVMWDSCNGTDFDVYARRFDAAGTALGNEFQVNTTSAGNQEQGGIAMAPDGRFAIGWASAGQDGSGVGAYVRFYDAAGNGDHRRSPGEHHDHREPVLRLARDGRERQRYRGRHRRLHRRRRAGRLRPALRRDRHGDRRPLHGQHEHRRAISRTRRSRPRPTAGSSSPSPTTTRAARTSSSSATTRTAPPPARTRWSTPPP